MTVPKKNAGPEQPLVDPKHEAFALGIFHGKTIVQAYRDAGYKTDDQHECYRASQRPLIRARIRYLKDIAAEAVMFRRQEWLRAQVEIADFDPRSVITWDEDGRPNVRASDELDAAAAKNIRKIHVTEVEHHDKHGNVTKTNRSVNVEFHDRQKALEAIGKFLGVFAADNMQKGVNVLLEAMVSQGRKALIGLPMDELESRIASLRAEREEREAVYEVVKPETNGKHDQSE